MARFTIDGSDLVLDFSPLERLGGLRRGARVPVDQVASVTVVDDPWRVVSGLRVGTGIPWVIVLGTMIRTGGNDVVAVYGGSPAVVVELRPGAPWLRLIATVDAPADVAATIEQARAA